MITDVEKVLNQWENYLKDLKARRLCASKVRDEQICIMDTLLKEITAVESYLDRAKSIIKKE